MLIIISELNIFFHSASVWYECNLFANHVRYFWAQSTEDKTENTYTAATLN